MAVPGVGSCRLRLSRPIEGRVKRIRITPRVDGWYALLVCEMAMPEALPLTGQSVGVDVGLRSFATLSNGEEIENPRCLKTAMEGLQKHQRRLSRKKRGSKNRAKAREKAARAHLKVRRTRKDFHHKASTDLVKRFERITVEELNILGMVKNPHLAQAISDVGWGSFFTMIQAKAERAGRVFEKVEARYTSQKCRACGHRQKMPLGIRVYCCEQCRIVIGRDHNAAINVDRAGQARISTPVEKRGSVSKKRERVRSSQSEPWKGRD